MINTPANSPLRPPREIDNEAQRTPEIHVPALPPIMPNNLFQTPENQPLKNNGSPSAPLKKGNTEGRTLFLDSEDKVITLPPQLPEDLDSKSTWKRLKPSRNSFLRRKYRAVSSESKDDYVTAAAKRQKRDEGPDAKGGNGGFGVC